MKNKDIIRLEALDGLRGTLAITVMLSHFIGSIYGWSDERFLIGAYLSVIYFFMMSGFVLSYAHNNKENFFKYFLTRLARLLPLHIVSTVLIVAIFKYNSMHGAYFPNDDVFSFKTILKNIAFLNGIYWKDFYVINAPSWSISIEFWVSLLIPLIFRKLSPRLKFLLIMAEVSYLIRYLEFGFQQSLFVAQLSMLIGAFCFDLTKTARLRRFLNDEFSSFLIAISFMYILIGIGIENHTRKDILYMIVFIPLLFIDFCRDDFILKKVLSSRLFRFLGFISFPLYLLHDSIIVSGIYQTRYDFLSLLQGSLLSVAIAYLYAKYVDVPGYKYLKKFINNKVIIK